eukprot:TRINITY_DN4852_c0_g1_i3.p1 TRINITY_DN4852_c0_g1~~TRINITY_DN4852_c0_g1_i3.p1  ORF type:complete len:1950 (-),score=353.27 TRINITY_DN4852_c0_g1_i3:140-5989(-)
MPASTGSHALSTGSAARDPLLDLNREEDLVTRSFAQHVESAAFSFFYLLCKNARPQIRWAYIAIWVEFFQVLGFVFAPHLSWKTAIEPLQGFLEIFAAFPNRMNFLDYMFYLWASVAYILVTMAFLAIGMYRVWTAENATLGYWTTKALLISVNVLVHALFMPFAYIHAYLYACESDYHGKNVLMGITDESVECWKVPHIAYIVASGPFTFCLLLITTVFNLFYFDSSPESKHLLSRTHSRIEAISTFFKVTIVVASVNFQSYPWISLAALSCWSLSRFLLILAFQPYYRKQINALVVGLSSGVAFACLCFGLELLLPNNDLQIPAIIFYTGIIPAIYFGKRLVELRSDGLAELFTEASNENAEAPARRESASSIDADERPARGWQHSLHAGSAFSKAFNVRRLLCLVRLPTDVAIVARDIFFTEMKTKRSKQPSRETVEKVDMMFSDTLETYPESSLLLVSYMNFLFFHASLLDKFRIHADKLNQLQPFFDLKFVVYRKGRELEDQRQSTNSGSTSMDLASYIEFQTNYKAARKHHAEALKAIRRFWSLLLIEDDKFDLEVLPQAAKGITVATSAAQHHYESLLRRHPDAPRVFRSYAEFLLGTSHDSRKANSFLKKADELEDLQARRRAEENKRPTDLQNAGGNIDMDDKTKSVITIDGKGIIQSVNHTATKMLLYSRAELVNNNVKMIMPSPYSENHDSYLANYHRTGIKKVLGSIRTLDARKKNGELIPVRLAVHQTDVNGQVFFVGLLEKQEDNSCLLSVNTDGSILSCNQIFVKRFGRDAREMNGRNFGEFFSLEQSEGALTPIRNFEEVYGSKENAKLYARHGDGRWIQVILSPKKVSKDGSSHFRCTFEFLDDIEVMITIDAGGVIRSCNHFVKHIFGYSREDLIERKINTLMPAPYSYFHDSYLSTYHHTGVRNVLDKSRTVEGQHKDGSRFKVHLLASEGEVNGMKTFSARISFAKKTEIPSCRFTITQAGVIQSHSESAVALVGGNQALVGLQANKIFQPVSKSFEKDAFLDVLTAQASKGPISAILMQRTSEGVVEHVDSSIEVVLQELSGESFFIVRLFVVEGADVIVNLDAQGNAIHLNDLAPHLFGYPPNQISGKPIFEMLRVKDNAKMLAALGQSGELDDETQKPASESGLRPAVIADCVHSRVNLIAIHRDGNQIPIYLECSATPSGGYACRAARKRMVIQHLALSAELSSKFDIDLDPLMNSIKPAHDPEAAGLVLADEDALNFIASPKSLAKSPRGMNFADGPTSPQPKKRVQIGDGAEEESDKDASEDASSSQFSDGQSGIRRIQRLRHKFQQNVQRNKSIALLKRRVGIAVFALLALSLGLFASIDILSKGQRLNSYSVALTGTSLSLHNSLFMIVDTLNSQPQCQNGCPWNQTVLMDQLHSDAVMLENTLMALYMRENVEQVYKDTLGYSNYDSVLPSYEAENLDHNNFHSPGIKKLFTDSNIQVDELIDGSVKSSASPFIRAMRSYTFYARYLSTQKDWSGLLPQRYSFFILENGPKGLEQTWKLLLDEYYEKSNKDEDMYKLIEYVVVAFAIFSIAILGAFVIQPSFHLVHEERFHALKLFLLIPKSVVRALSRIRITVESSESNSEGSDNDENVDEDDELNHSENGKKKKNKKPEIMDESKKIYSIMRNRKIKEDKKKVDAVVEEGADKPEIKKGKDSFVKRMTLAHLKEVLLKFKVRRTTQKWVSLLSLIALGFACVAIIGDQDTESSHNSIRLVYYSSKLMAISQDVSYGCIQLVDRGAPVKQMQESLSGSLSEYFRYLQCITQGCKEEKVIRSDDDSNHADLFYSNRCFLRDAEQCPQPGSLLYQLSSSGMVNLASEIGRSANSIAQRNGTYSFSDTDFSIVLNGERDLLRKGLFTCTSLYANEVRTHLKAVEDHQGAIAGATSGFLLLSFFFFFRPMFNALEEENRSCNKHLHIAVALAA